MGAYPTNRSTPVPGHARGIGRALPDASIRGAVGNWKGGYACTCACGWVGETEMNEAAAIARHTAHKDAVRSGEWARLFEADRAADVRRRAEPFDLLAEVEQRIESRNAAFAAEIRSRR